MKRTISGKKGKQDSTPQSSQTKVKQDLLYDIEKDNDEYYIKEGYEPLENEYEKGEPQKKEGEIKIVTYNVASWNAAMKKGLDQYIKDEDPDILCIQETKLQDNVCPIVSGYKGYWSASTAKKGYAGTAILTKEKPLSFSKKINGKLNEHGRIITVEYERFYLVNTYVVVTEEYAGASYVLYNWELPDSSIITPIEEDDDGNPIAQTWKFWNKLDDKRKKGYGIKNTFTKGEENWNYPDAEDLDGGNDNYE